MESFVGVLIWVHVCLYVFLFLISAFGRRLGLRKLYIELLLKLFLFSQEKVDKKEEKKRRLRGSSFSLDESDFVDQTQKLSMVNPVYIGVNREDGSGFHLEDILEYITAGMSAIVDDTVTTNFIPEEPKCWNLLSRNNRRSYEFISVPLTLLWMIGVPIRYLFLLPTRLLVLATGMLLLFISTAIVGAIPDGQIKRKLNRKLSIISFDFVASSLSLFATFHNRENRPESGITVANHTSPIDSLVLSTDNVYDMVGQIHGGLIGYFETLLGRSSSHIWFERSNAKDRSVVCRRLKEHTANPDLPSILIFPEGVCVNNTSVLQFKKGAFEVDSVIFPVAIRFDSRFGDAFWWQDAFFSYVLYMMTSWAIVCDVWYLPPVVREEGESAAAFADRVKAMIAAKGGMSDLSVDGFLKVNPPREEVRQKHQLEFAKHCQLHSYALPHARLISRIEEVPEESCKPIAVFEDAKNEGDSLIQKDSNVKSAFVAAASERDETQPRKSAETLLVSGTDLTSTYSNCNFGDEGDSAAFHDKPLIDNCNRKLVHSSRQEDHLMLNRKHSTENSLIEFHESQELRQRINITESLQSDQ